MNYASIIFTECITLITVLISSRKDCGDSELVEEVARDYVGETLQEELDIHNSFTIPEPKRVLIILDNVCKPLDADGFLNGFDWVGPGNLIIITSRDKQVFLQCGIDQIYEVKGLNEDEAKQLFFRCAFGIDWRKKHGLENLAPDLMSVIQYSSGNPLALSLYGKMMSHKKPKEMEAELLSEKARTSRDSI
ncbi:unnamed protein product [Thlaspi arvense]|uniref:NB-ARC domain-containing protein n=1 Tax=Thlaspi arvense TaxID=13288 RepID=A0AAU9RU93_THLAR|nr:unnamed protein product [Thlaspi arvense]